VQPGHGPTRPNAGDGSTDRPPAEAPPTAKRILVATDFSKGAERALAVGIEMAQACDATMDLLHVYPPVTYTSAPPVPGTFPAAPSPAALDHVARALDELADRVRDAGIACRTASVEGDPAVEIAAYASGAGDDLIVMGTQGRTGLRRLVLGSVAEQTLRRSTEPVLVVPSQDADAPAAGPAPDKLST
jgi:nucleotide-binding universal stress UspA family protein